MFMSLEEVLHIEAQKQKYIQESRNLNVLLFMKDLNAYIDRARDSNGDYIGGSGLDKDDLIQRFLEL